MTEIPRDPTKSSAQIVRIVFIPTAWLRSGGGPRRCFHSSVVFGAVRITTKRRDHQKSDSAGQCRAYHCPAAI